jgi:predicted small lipoprotein YifL
MSLNLKRLTLSPGLVVMLLSLLLFGCGKKGPLKLPDTQANVQMSSSPSDKAGA